ncbi:MAG: dihydrolipoamide acetyltransferase family protein, partial [Planctomycetota bacterium]
APTERPGPPPAAREDQALRTSPLVRRLAAEHGVRLEDVPGSGIGGRVTKDDILRYVRERDEGDRTRPSVAGRPAAEPAGAAPGDRVEPMSPMRIQIADHLASSIRTAVHATTVFEVDMTRVREARSYLSARLEDSHNIRLTYLPFIVQAAARALRKYPVLNASIEGRMVRYHEEVNIGIAVALDDGLIVPVLRRADALDLIEIARSIQDLARRARAKDLDPSDVQGGTFTITNPGLFGGIIGTPILHQPQVGILYVGAVTKRPVVLPDTDAIAVRSMAYLCLTMDHRLIDGAMADRFLSSVKATLESGDFDAGPRWR